MSKYETIPRKKSSRFVTGLWVGISIANCAHLLVNALDTDEVNTKQLQTNNEQVEMYLSEDFSDINTLVLDPSDKTFTFSTEMNDTQEYCNGEYTVTDEIVSLAGDITCARTIEMEGR